MNCSVLNYLGTILRIKERCFKIKLHRKVCSNLLKRTGKNDSVFKKLFCNCVCTCKIAVEVFNDYLIQII